MTTQTAIKYRTGETFTCIKREFDPTSGDGVGAECGAEIVMHGFHWCAQVCPKCLGTYRATSANEIVRDHGWFDGATRPLIVANIAANGGQYIPTF